jgi:flagellar hook-basal body complex protein FliE
MLPSFFSTNRIVNDPFKLDGLRTDIFDKIREREDEENAEISPEESFGKVLFKALGDVNSLQIQSSALTEKLVTNPNSVDIHDVTMAGAKATLALSITKELIDRAIRAYKEIINVR